MFHSSIHPSKSEQLGNADAKRGVHGSEYILAKVMKKIRALNIGSAGESYDGGPDGGSRMHLVPLLRGYKMIMNNSPSLSSVAMMNSINTLVLCRHKNKRYEENM